MPPWALQTRRYFPILHAFRNDLFALDQLPSSDGDYLMPVVPLARFATARQIDNTLDRVRNAVANKGGIFIADISEQPVSPPTDPDGWHPVHEFFQQITNPRDGYRMWREFVRGEEDIVPVVQIGSPEQVRTQIEDFLDLGRGVVLRLRVGSAPGSLGLIEPCIQQAIQARKINDLLILLDFESVNDPLGPAAVASGIVNRCAAAVGGNGTLCVATSATSYPVELTGEASDLINYPIAERLLNEQVIAANPNPNISVLYSDYGSARVRAKEKQSGGPAYPRVDFAGRQTWYSNRQKNGEEGEAGYQDAANFVIRNAPEWSDELSIYGANMIREAADGNLDKKLNASFWVSVRVNLHLHRQAHYYSDDDTFYNTETEWDDM